jgi:aryl-alcohol dehydrogenase-like predicted oxidoreductase
MQTCLLGNTDIAITPLIFGTWQAGKRGWVGVDDAAVMDAMRAALDAGITTFDTAEIYGDGHSETLVGKALGSVRDRVVLMTKVFPTHLKKHQVIAACEASLQRLQTDVIDLYQIHWPAGRFNSEVVPLSETMEAMVSLLEQGKIRAIGVSNFSRSQLAEALSYGPIASLQPPYSLFWRQVEQDAKPLCDEHHLSVLAYSSLAQGLLTGKFGPDHQFPPGDVRATNRLFKGELYQRAQAALDQLRPIADRYQTPLGHLALAWLLAQPQTCAIVGARSASQAQANAQAADLTLSPTDLAEIDRIGRTVTDSLDDNPVMWDL